MLGTRSIRRCQKLMNSRTLMAAVLLLSACASARQGRVSPGPGPTPQAKATGHRVPALFRQAPWAIETDADGNVVHIQEEAGVQFPLVEEDDTRRTRAGRRSAGLELWPDCRSLSKSTMPIKPLCRFIRR
jgi:hypothetical protein